MINRLGIVLVLLVLAGGSSACGTPSSASPPTPRPPAPDASCKLEVQSHSLNSDTPTSFTIINKTHETLTLFWLNFQGKRVKYFDFAPGVTQIQATYVTHPWVVADPSGMCLRLFLITTATTITIG